MISLHDAYEVGSDAVRRAILAFGARHLPEGAGPNAEPDWKRAEKHFTHLIETIMGTAVPSQATTTAIVHRAENEAIGFLLAVNARPHYRCPICVKRQGSS